MLAKQVTTNPSSLRKVPTDHARSGFITVDTSGQIRYINALAAEWLHLPAQLSPGQTAFDYLSCLFPPEFQGDHAALMVRGAMFHFKSPVAEKNAEFDVITFSTGAILSISLRRCPVIRHPVAVLPAGDEDRFVAEAIANERAAIGKELHDNVNQVLGATKLYVAKAREEAGAPGWYFDKISAYLDTAIQEIRKYSADLQSHRAQVVDLISQVQSLIADISLVCPIKIVFECSGVKELRLDENLSTCIFRMVQEQLNNILKHADASSVSIDLRCQHGGLVLAIADNGKGCDWPANPNGIGLQNMVARAAQYNGKVMFHSKKGQGFKMRVKFTINTRRTPVASISAVS